MNEKREAKRFDLALLPPQAVDLEIELLGFFIAQSDLLSENIAFIKPEFFYKENHQVIFNAMSNLLYRNDSVDFSTVNEELKRMGKLEEIGGIDKLLSLTTTLGYGTTVETRIRIITEKFIQREIISNTHKLSQQCYDPTSNLSEIIKNFDEFNSKINQYIIGKDYEISYSSLVENTYKEIVSQAKSQFSGIDTGSLKLNGITGGWINTYLIILCAYTGVGKTTRMINFVKSAVKQGKKCAIFSLEMSAAQLIKKQLVEQSGVFGNKILESNLSEQEVLKINSAHMSIKEYPIYLNEKTSVTPNYIRQVCRERKRKYGLDMIFIDYLQIMSPNEKTKFQNKEQEIASISLALKNIAKELNIPVMALCQLNRDIEKRADKRPMKSDLRHSGQIEQDADLILTLYRPCLYYDFGNDPDYKDKNIDEDSYNRISELAILKNRHGKSEVFFQERFYGELSRFETSNS